MAESRLMLDLGLDESGSLISPFEDMLELQTRRMKKMGEMGRKKGLDDLHGKPLRLHLHYIWLRRKPHGLIGRGPEEKSLPGPAHELEPAAQ
jgi:hypothetical protein